MEGTEPYVKISCFKLILAAVHCDMRAGEEVKSVGWRLVCDDAAFINHTFAAS